MTLPTFRQLLSQHQQRRAAVVLLVLLSLLLAGCAASGQMAIQPRYDPFERSEFFADGMASRHPPAGSVPYALSQGVSPFEEVEGSEPLSPNSPILTGVNVDGNPIEGFPLPVDQALVTLGKERFDIYCVPCHGPSGEGNGRAVPFGVTRPPSLIEGAGLSLTTGTIFQVITEGKGQMFPYAYRVNPHERWAIIAYIRALQINGGPADPAGLSPADLQTIESQP